MICHIEVVSIVSNYFSSQGIEFCSCHLTLFYSELNFRFLTVLSLKQKKLFNPSLSLGYEERIAFLLIQSYKTLVLVTCIQNSPDICFPVGCKHMFIKIILYRHKKEFRVFLLFQSEEKEYLHIQMKNSIFDSF